MAIIESILQSMWKVSETKEAKISLQDELLSCGVPVIASNLVHTFQRATLHGLRPGVWYFIGPMFRLVLSLCSLLLGATLLQVWSEYTTKKISQFALLLPFAVIMTSLFGLSIESALGVRMSIAGLLSIPLCAFLVMNVIVSAEHRYTRFAQATSAWIIARVNIRGFGASYDIPCVPSHLRERLSKASTIRGARLYVEYLEEDPFLVVIRGHFFFKEKVYIGAWKTGNHHFDNL